MYFKYHHLRLIPLHLHCIHHLLIRRHQDLGKKPGSIPLPEILQMHLQGGYAAETCSDQFLICHIQTETFGHCGAE